MKRGYDSERNRIEQAIARGESLDWIVEHLDVEPAVVDRVLRRMDEAIAEDDLEPAPRDLRPHGTHAAFWRHRKRGDTPCTVCVAGERAYDAEKHRQLRTKAS